MTGQYITPLDLSNGFAPGQVTFSLDFPGCPGKLDPIKVSYHNVDWFEPGRTNTFRQFQQAGDVNPHLAPLCVCLEPLKEKSAGPCANSDYRPNKWWALSGMNLQGLFSGYVSLCESIAPAPSNTAYYPSYLAYGRPAILNAIDNLGRDLTWNGPHLFGYRLQRDFLTYGYEPGVFRASCIPAVIFTHTTSGGGAWRVELQRGGPGGAANTSTFFAIIFFVSTFVTVTAIYRPTGSNFYRYFLTQLTIANNGLAAPYMEPPTLAWANANFPSFFDVWWEAA